MYLRLNLPNIKIAKLLKQRASLETGVETEIDKVFYSSKKSETNKILIFFLSEKYKEKNLFEMSNIK